MSDVKTVAVFGESVSVSVSVSAPWNASFTPYVRRGLILTIEYHRTWPDALCVCVDYCDVKVHVGNAGPYLYRCIRYETGQGSRAWIIGLAVGLAVLLILIVVVVVVVCVYRRRRRAKNKNNDDDVSNDLEMSPVSAQHCPTDAGHVEW